MDYVVGSVAALVSGNVTPNRPKFLKRALTPTKHQPSPNVTPKSELVEDRTIFLSPSLQKKKAIVKKSPKRIFQNPDPDNSNDSEGPNTKSPKADKVKKHLKEDLEADVNLSNAKSPKNKSSKVKEPPQQNLIKVDGQEGYIENSQEHNERTPKKKKKKQVPIAEDTSDVISSVCYPSTNDSNEASKINSDAIGRKNKNKTQNHSPKKIKNKNHIQSNDGLESIGNEIENDSCYEKNLLSSPKKKSKVKEIHGDSNIAEDNSKGENTKQETHSENGHNENSNKENEDDANSLEGSGNVKTLKKKNRKRKNKSKSCNEKLNTEINVDVDKETKVDNTKNSKKKKKNQTFVNPNAITNKETDSEHDSDDNIESENEQNNKEVLDTGPAEESSDEEEKVPEKKIQKDKEITKNTEEEVNRTLFVGNVPFSAKCKKEIKKIFSKYGQIETVRIRTVPVKDGRATPKLAIIKNELHPDRSTVNVYVKFCDASSVKEALAENGTVLNDHHLRVTRSDCTGSEHDPKSSIFIGNLPFALEDEALQQKFQQCGDIVSVRIIRDRKTNAGKGFGYVNFKSKDAVELALALSEEELTIKNRILRVKRCTQATKKQKIQKDNRTGNYQGNNQRVNPQGNYGRRPQGNYGRGQQGNHGRGQQGNYSRENTQGNYGRGNFQGRNQFGNRDDNRRVERATNNDTKADGAMRRLMNKRKNQDGSGDGPPNKRERNINQPGKKIRKEFVGMTGEKKKKNKIDKGQKKKKALSEILTK